MRIDLVIEREASRTWTVINAKTGLACPCVTWADDALHQIGVCTCAYGFGFEIAAFDCNNPQIFTCPKVVIDITRLTVLIEVQDDLRDDSLWQTDLSKTLEKIN